MRSVLLSLVIPLLVMAIIAIDRLWPPTPRDLAWLAGHDDVPDDEAKVLRRYLQRHRVHRFVGGIVGLVAAILVGAGWGGNVPLQHVIFWGTAGVLVGALSAESFRLGSGAGQAVASLEPRDRAPRADLVTAARWLVAATAGAGLAVWLWRGEPAPAAIALAGIAVSGLAELTRAQIVSRRRPVLSERAHALDARIRAFAGESVARLQFAAAILLATIVLASLPVTAAPLDAVRGLGALAGLVAAIIQMRRAAPRPPRGWRPAT